MNRFALLDDSDNEETKTSVAASKDKKKKDKEAKPTPAPEAETAKAAPKKDGEPRKKPAGAKPNGEGKPKTPRPVAPAAEAAPEVDDAGFIASKGEGRDHHKKLRDSRKDKKDRNDLLDPSIKSDNRIRDAAHGGNKGKGKGGGKGKDKNDGPSVVKETEDAENDAANEVAEVVVDKETVEETPVPAEPEGPATLTLDEYYRQRDEARAASAILSAAKAARAVEEDFKGLKIKGDEEEDVGVFTGVANKAKKEKASSQRSTAKTVLTDLSFKGEEAAVEEPRGDRGGDRRSGRGGGRGERGSPRSGGGTPRTPRGAAKIDIADSNAFPKL